MKKWMALSIGLVAAAGYWMWPVSVPEVGSRGQTSGAGSIASSAPNTEGSKVGALTAAKAAIEVPKVAKLGPAKTGETGFGYFREVAIFNELKKKVFLSAEEKAQKKAFFANTELIQGLGEFLRTPVGPEFESLAQQGAALDLVFEALKSAEGHDAATLALKEVVLDSKIENEQLDMTTRKNLAGVKAEVLYQWVAFEPGISTDLKKWLPGPVSEKIWENVNDAQDRNVRESIVVGQGDF